MISKKATSPLSISILVFLIIAVTILGLIISFNKTIFGKIGTKFEEQIAREPEPLIPSASQPITVSRNNIKTERRKSEVIKFSVFNPTGEDWIFRHALHGGKCGVDGDLICFIDPLDTTNICDTYEHADKNDGDCGNTKKYTLDYDGICVVHTIDNPDGRGDPDCAPQEGVQLSLSCDDKLIGKTFQYNTKIIKAGDYDSFTALVEIEERAPKGTYLCKINLLINNYEHVKDVIFSIE